jgi:type IV pilus assembly protein PilB
MSNSDNRLGELLLRSSLINQGQLQRARQAQQQQGGRLGYHLTKLGFVKEPDLTSFLSKQHGVPSIKLSELTEVDPAILQLIPREVAERNLAFPVSRAGQSLIVAMVDPSNLAAIDDLKFRTGYSIEVVVTSEQGLREAIEVHYRPETNYDDIFNDFALDEVTFSEDGEEMESANELQNAAEEAPVVRLVNAILVDAIRRGASDIHIEPYEKSFRVRYRVDGVLNESMNPPLKLRNALTSRLKIMSNLDIAERRLPQDGRIKLKLGKGQEMDFRVSVLPTLFGEKIVLRLLDKSNLQLDMTKLGFDPKPLANFQKAIHLPYGMCLVTGPTGSGKTTTLYSALSELNKSTENISTAEDPVEFNLAGINQVQIQDGIGLNFAAALRSFLRQDPDIIMVGEIRDFETAEIAIKAALTGHMVLSTLHTNDAPGTINRLLNMGIEPVLVSSAVNLVLAQRLARKVCKDCGEQIKVAPEVLREIQVPEDKIATAKICKGKGCPTCGGSGYKGRVALYEVMVMDDVLREGVQQGLSTSELKALAIRQGMQTLRMAGNAKLIEGLTTVEEIARVTAPD